MPGDNSAERTNEKISQDRLLIPVINNQNSNSQSSSRGSDNSRQSDSNDKRTTAAQFLPLIQDVSKLADTSVKLYNTAELNKRICGLLLNRVQTAKAAVETLKIRKSEMATFFQTKENYPKFWLLTKNIEKIKGFIEDISQIKGLRKFTNVFLAKRDIKDSFYQLTNEFDDIVKGLNFRELTQIQLEKNKIVDEEVLDSDIRDMNDFLSEIEGGIGAHGKISEVVETVSKLNESWRTQQAMHPASKSQQASVDDVLDDPLLEPSAFTDCQAQKGKVQHRRFMINDTYLDVAWKEIISDKMPIESKNNIKTQVNILKKFRTPEQQSHIIRFYGLVNDNGKQYLVTEWADHGNLSEYYKANKGHISWITKIGFAVDICRGMNLLRAVEIIHHDIRPENILIFQDKDLKRPLAKIANFGLSRGFSEATQNIGANVTNVRYMAPEKLKERTFQTNYECEIYSFGVVLWEIAEEEPPYRNVINDIVSIRKHVLIDKKREDFTRPDVPEEWQNLYRETVDEDPTNRPVISEAFKRLNRLWKQYNEPQIQPSSHSDSKYAGVGPMVTINPSIASNVDERDEEHSLPIEHPPSNTPIPPKNQPTMLSPTTMTVPQAINEHKRKLPNRTEQIWQTFDEYEKLGDITAKYWKGYYLFYNLMNWPEADKAERMKNAASYFGDAAQHDMPEAQLRYGHCLWRGEGVKKDFAKAIKYFEKAAEHGNSTAMYNIGNVYYNGIGVEKDEQKGQYFLRQAAYGGQPKAAEMCKKKNISL